MPDRANTLNQARVITAKTFLKLGWITRDQYQEFIRDYFIIVSPPGILTKLTDKLLKRKRPENTLTYYDMVHLVLPDHNQNELQLDELSGKAKTIARSRFDGLDKE